jgi:hypothetical protein
MRFENSDVAPDPLLRMHHVSEFLLFRVPVRQGNSPSYQVRPQRARVCERTLSDHRTMTYEMVEMVVVGTTLLTVRLRARVDEFTYSVCVVFYLLTGLSSLS